jgi:hypothetical protein
MMIGKLKILDAGFMKPLKKVDSKKTQDAF